MKKRFTGLLFLAAMSLHPSAVTAQAGTTIEPSLLNKAGLLCIKVSRQGRVTGASVITTTGDPKADRDMLRWARGLRFPASRTGDRWFPMPAAFGDAPVPAMPPSCSPPLPDRRR